MDMEENARGQGGRKGMTDQQTELSKAHGNNDAADSLSLKPLFAPMRAYVEAGHSLILLHRGDKRPISTGWTRIQADPAEVLAHAEREGLNVGVRLCPVDLVIDADPRNYPAGRDSLAELASDIGLDLNACPHVITGGGGHHYHLRKPADMPILGTLAKYPGVEFKTSGQQVVAAGSVHPNGKRYESEFFLVGLDETPLAPDSLLALIRRPELQQGVDAELWGELTPEMLASTLEYLDPSNFREHEEWLNLMMACHHATGGKGREQFIDWSTDDPDYTDHRYIIGRRWDSLHSVGRGGKPITVKYLHKVVQAAGGAVPHSSPEDDFDIVPFDGEMLPAMRRTDAGKIVSNFPNCLKLMRHIRDQLGLAYDEFGGSTHLTAPELPWNVDVGRRLDDDVVRRIRQYFVEATDANWTKDDVLEAALTIARENTVHPVRDYLNDLTWDGVPRIDKLLVTYAGAMDNAYVRAIGAKTLIAGVRRVRQPGCKFDNVIVLEGSQGSGKSSFVKLLSPHVEWFSDSPIGNTESKDAPLSLQGRWIIELGEMSVLSKSGVEALKAFVSSSIDHVRRPYGRLHEELRRQCIFIGTTNQATYLKDQTGNRRFWPVKVGVIDLDALIADRDQLWAEAAAREAAGESLFLPQDLWEMAAIEQEERVSEDPWADILRAYVDRKIVWVGDGNYKEVEPMDRVHTSMLLTDALQIPAGSLRPEHTQRLKIVMEKYLGWEHKSNVRVGHEGRQGRGYVRP